MGNEARQGGETTCPEPMGPALQDQGMQARVAPEHFPARAGCGIALKDASNVFTNAAEQVELSEGISV